MTASPVTHSWRSVFATALFLFVLSPDTEAAEVRPRSFGGTVLSPDGKPLRDAEVMLIVSDHRANYDVVSTIRSDATGHFAFRDQKLNEQYALLAARAPGLALSGAVAVEDDDAEITLSPVTSVRVTFLDPDGKPVPGLRVAPTMTLPRSPEFTGALIFPRQISQEVVQVTDAQGACTFFAMPQRASLRLRVDDPRFSQLTHQDNIALGDAAQSAPTKILLKPGASICGVVTYGPTAKPAAGARVIAQAVSASGPGWGEAVTNNSGEYEMRQLQQGDYNVTVDRRDDTNHEWAVAALEHVKVAQGQRLVGQNLTLVKGALITGHVRRADTRKGVPEISIGVHGPDHPRSSAMIGGVTTDAEGAYTLRVAPGAQYVYLASLPPEGYDRPKPREFSVNEGENFTLDFDLPRKPGKPVAGRVIGPDDKPVPRAFVTAEFAGRDEIDSRAFQKADQNGSFTFVAITPGTKLRAGRGKLETLEAVTVNGGEDDITLRVHPRQRLSVTGIITDVHDKPIEGARVNLTTWEGQLGHGSSQPEITDAQGRYTIRGLKPDGRYSLDAQADGYGKGFAQVELRPGEPLAQVQTIKLQPAIKRIAGKVVDTEGNIVPGIKVELNGGVTGYQTTTTDARGRFSFKVVEGARALIYLRDADGNPMKPRDAWAGNVDLELLAPKR